MSGKGGGIVKLKPYRQPLWARWRAMFKEMSSPLEVSNTFFPEFSILEENPKIEVEEESIQKGLLKRETQDRDPMYNGIHLK